MEINEQREIRNAERRLAELDLVNSMLLTESIPTHERQDTPLNPDANEYVPKTSDITQTSQRQMNSTHAVHLSAVHQQIAHQPTVHQPTIHQPIVQQPTVHHPTIHQHSVQPPTVHSPTIHQPNLQPPTVHQPIVHLPTDIMPSIHTIPSPLVSDPANKDVNSNTESIFASTRISERPVILNVPELLLAASSYGMPLPTLPSFSSG